jgi:hypothetical protein
LELYPAFVFMTKVFICLPAFKHTNTSFTTASLVALTRFLTERGQFYGFAQKSFPDIADLRAVFLTLWFDHHPEATHILFYDDDMQAEPQLVLDMIDFNEPFVGCIYPKRTLPITWVGGAVPGDQIVKNGFMKVEGVGCGIALISRECVQNLIDTGNVELDEDLESCIAGQAVKAEGSTRLIRAFEKMHLPGRRLSEDYSFCERHRRAGGEVWAAIHHKITHVGDYGFSGRFADNIDDGTLKLVEN